jgi:hypothetical protein
MASLTIWDFLALIQPGFNLFHRVTLTTAQTNYPPHIAMEFKHLVIWQPCLLVETIYILSNDTIKLTQPIQLSDSQVGWIGLSLSG